MTAERIDTALQMRAEGPSHTHIAKVFGVGPSSVARALTQADTQRDVTST